MQNESKTELLDRAVTSARGLSPEMQDDIARMVLMLAGESQASIALTVEDAASFATSLEQAARRAYASEDAVRAVWAKHGP